MQPEAITEIPTTEEAFRELVDQVAGELSVTRVRAVQLVLDQLRKLEAARGAMLACTMGCSACCKQMVAVTPLEWQEIARYLLRSPELRKKLRDRTRELILEFRAYLKGNQKRAHDPVGLARDWEDRPCVFLSPEGACEIYPVRPVVCRVVTGTIRCASIWQSKRWRYEWEYWGDLLATEEEKRVARGQLFCTPLPALLEQFFKKHK